MAEFHPEARLEILEAVDGYEARPPGLGADRLDRLEARVAMLEERPGIGSIVPLRRKRVTVRRFARGRFPFLLVYPIRDEGLPVVALAHTSRRPL